MKHRFLLDENVLYFAILQINENGVPDFTALQLMQNINANCHKIVLNPEIKKRYSRQLKKLLGDRPALSRPPEFIRNLLYKREKFEEIYDVAPPFDGEEDFPEKEDVPIVRALCQLKAPLVTGEGKEKLLRAVNKMGLPDVAAIKPSEALKLAQQS